MLDCCVAGWCYLSVLPWLGGWWYSIFRISADEFRGNDQRNHYGKAYREFKGLEVDTASEAQKA